MRREEFCFDLQARVRLIEINRPGVVTSLRVDHCGRAYLVAYWNDCQRKEEWVYEWELEERGE